MNQRELDLIEDPPPKCPYFTVPDPRFFITPEEVKAQEALKHTNASVVDLFGPFDKMDDDQQAKFILTLIQHSGFTPDYDAMAAALNLSNGNIVRRRFVAIAERQGFDMDGDRLKSTEPTTPMSSQKKGTPKAAPRRRKSRATSDTDKDRSTDRQTTIETSIQQTNPTDTTSETNVHAGYESLSAEAHMAELDDTVC